MEKTDYSEASQFVFPAIYIIGMRGQRRNGWVGYVARMAFRHALKALVEKHKGQRPH
jgi:hypothetical protein